MGIREALLWPVARIAAWVDDNPLSAASVVVAAGALAAVVASAGLESGGSGSGTAAVAYDGVTADAVVETALAHPAYPAVALLGLVVFALYDG